MNFYKVRLLFLGLFLLFFCVACRTGHCRRDHFNRGRLGSLLKKINPKSTADYRQNESGEATIAKSDGSIQCEPNSGLSLEQMAKEQLTDIELLSSEKRNDGLIRTQKCGSDSGVLNTYRIKIKNLIEAQKAGFILLPDMDRR